MHEQKVTELPEIAQFSDLLAISKISSDHDLPLSNELRAKNHWIQMYGNGMVTKDELLTTARNIVAVRQAYRSLPESLQRDLYFTIDDDVDDPKGAPIEGVDELILTPEIYQDGELITALISAGIFPSKDLRDRLHTRPEMLHTVSSFSRSLFPLFENDRELKKDFSSLNIDHFLLYGDYFVKPDKVRDNWINAYVRGKIPAETLITIGESIARFSEAEERFYEEEDLSSVERVAIAANLSRLYANQEALTYVDAVSTLLSMGIVPTSHLIQFLVAHEEDGVEELVRLREQTARGQLNEHSDLQRDIEFLKYLRITINTNARTVREISPRAIGRYKAFTQLPYVPEVRNSSSLTSQEKMEAEAAAFEAAIFYWFVQDRVGLGRRVAVIGNRSYGADFVVDVLRSDLEDIGVRMSTYDYVHSGGGVRPQQHRITQRYLDQEQPDDIIIVDGTRDSFVDYTPRLPSSMNSYYQWFSGESGDVEKGHYAIRYWVPNPTNQILLGSIAVPYAPPSNESPQVILANPVITPSKFPRFPEEFKDHKQGFFDDPTDGSPTKIVFTSTGLQKLVLGRTREQYIVLAQDEIEQALPEMIQKTNPLFRNF